LNLIRIMPAKGRIVSRPSRFPRQSATTDGRPMLTIVTRFALLAGFLAAWEAIVRLLETPAFILPPPSRILQAFSAQPGFFLHHAGITALEVVLGLAAGVAAGIITALVIMASPRLARLVGPALIASQALPVFAIAPLLVIWFGFGMTSKIVMAALIIYFPVATAFVDGLKRTDPGLIDLAQLNNASALQTFAFIRIPAALPAFGSGLRVAAGIAPIGAIVGEWVGASAGLAFIMLQANARMQTDSVFVALILLALMALLLRAIIERIVGRFLFWVPGETRTSGTGRDPAFA
jgi:putative hydroxymethylpyrimidine transport system permease protein